MTQPSGVLVADKPRGPTSHDVVAQARRLYGTRRVGHAGTLDPMATGVLVLLFGEATKLSPYLTSRDKRYRATVCFGRATDTLDADGRVVDERPLAPDWLLPDALDEALAAERARLSQVPPAFSALKLDGRRAHRLSRRGAPVELLPREVHVAELVLVEATAQRVLLELSVSKGYYVRALARDLGERLGVPAHLSELRRTASGSFTLSDAVAWPPAQAAVLMATAAATRRELPCAELTPPGANRARHGHRLARSDFGEDPEPAHDRAEALGLPAAWLDPDGRLVALGQRCAPDEFAVIRGFCG